MILFVIVQMGTSRWNRFALDFLILYDNDAWTHMIL